MLSKTAILCGMTAFCLCAAGCKNAEDREIMSQPTLISQSAFVLDLEKPLIIRGHFSDLCIALPSDFDCDFKTFEVRNASGASISVEVLMTTSRGVIHKFDQPSFLFSDKRYLCLSRNGAMDFSDKYVRVEIISNSPFWAEKIKWLSTNER
jgi:hypothetical protein